MAERCDALCWRANQKGKGLGFLSFGMGNDKALGFGKFLAIGPWESLIS